VRVMHERIDPQHTGQFGARTMIGEQFGHPRFPFAVICFDWVVGVLLRGPRWWQSYFIQPYLIQR
jgi:hypothetical protein